MSKVGLVTDAELARAREDPAFRQQLVAGNLEMLLDQINKMRDIRVDAVESRQVREAVRLAVQLAELLRRIHARLCDESRVA